MGHGTHVRDVKILSRYHQRGAFGPTDKGGPSCQYGRIPSVRPPGTEVKTGSVLGTLNHPGCLGGDQGLKVHHTQQIGFEDLNVDGSTGDVNDRFIGKSQRAFRHGIDIAIKLEIPKVVDEIVTQFRPRWPRL